MDHPPTFRSDLGSEATPRESGFDSTERVLGLIHWTSAAGRQLRRQLGEMATALALSDSELLVIWFCRGAGRVQVELAGAIGVSPAQMSGIVERLRSRGLVAVHRMARDRRRQVWRTSPVGQALLDDAAPRLEDLSRSFDDVLSPDEQQAAATICQRLAEMAGSSRGAAKASLSDSQDWQRREEAA